MSLKVLKAKREVYVKYGIDTRLLDEEIRYERFMSIMVPFAVALWIVTLGIFAIATVA